MLSGKRALVTGASSGIGFAIAEALRDAGASVIGLCRSVDRLPEGVEPLACDLSEQASIIAAFETIESLDILVNNAGLAHMSSIIDGDPAQWEAMWRINVQGLAICCQLALPKFSDSGGRILNVSSMSGHRVPATGGFYPATKFAVRAISDSLRLELKAVGSKTQVGCLSPGFVDTPLLDIYFEGRETQLAETKASVNMLRAEDVAAAALHVLSAPPGVEIGDILLRSADQKS